MISGSTANIKGDRTPVSMADHSPNTIISCFKPSDHPSATILVVSIDHIPQPRPSPKIPKIQNKPKFKTVMYNSTHPIWYLNFAMLVEFYLWVNIFQYQHVLAELRHQWRCQATTNQNLGNLGPKTGRTIWDGSSAHVRKLLSTKRQK